MANLRSPPVDQSRGSGLRELAFVARVDDPQGLVGFGLDLVSWWGRRFLEMHVGLDRLSSSSVSRCEAGS